MSPLRLREGLGDLHLFATWRVPGCLAYYYNYSSGRKEFTSSKAFKGVLVGYDHLSRCYLIYHLKTQRIVRSSDCIFREDLFPLASPSSRTSQASSMADVTEVDRLIFGQREGEEPAQQVQSAPGTPQTPPHTPDVGGAPSPAASPSPSWFSSDPGSSSSGSACLYEDDSRSPSMYSPSQNSSADEELPEDAMDGDMQEHAPARRSSRANLGTWFGREYAKVAEGDDESQGLCTSVFDYFTTQADAMLSTAMDTEIVALALSAVSDVANTVHGTYEPATFAQATSCSDSAKWWASMSAEMQAMARLNVFTYVPRSSIPVGAKIIRCRWVFKVKPDKLKSRLVICGYLQDFWVGDVLTNNEAGHSPTLVCPCCIPGVAGSHS